MACVCIVRVREENNKAAIVKLSDPRTGESAAHRSGGEDAAGVTRLYVDLVTR